MKDDFKEEEEEWIQDTRRKEYDQEAIRYIEEETYMSDTYSTGNSDIDIIASDGIVFKAHTVILRQASLVHQSSLPPLPPLTGHTSIELTNDDTGHSSVLKIYLDLIYPNNRVKIPLKDGLLIRQVIRLARLWKSLPALDRISREVFLGALSGLASISFPTLFIIAVGLEDPTLLGFIVAQTEQRQWVFAWSDMNCVCLNSIASMREERSEVERQHHYDFGCWPLEHYQSIPSHIIHTLIILTNASAKAVNYSSMGRQLRMKLLQTHGRSNYWTGMILPDGVDVHLPHCRGEEERIRYIDEKDRRGAGSGGFDFEEKWWNPKITPDSIKVQTPIPRYDSNGSDMVIVSSDGVSFRVHSTILAKASVVIADSLDMHSVDQGELVMLCDRVFEHSVIITALMDFLYISKALWNHNVDTLLQLIDLADKWDLVSLRTSIEELFDAPSFRDFDLFLLAIRLKNYAMAADLIKADQEGGQGDMMWYDRFPPVQALDRHVCALEWSYSTANDRSKSTRIRNIKSLGYLDFLQLPSQVAWALQRAAIMWEHDFTDGHELKPLPGNKYRMCNRNEDDAQRFRIMMMSDYATWEPLSSVAVAASRIASIEREMGEYYDNLPDCSSGPDDW